MLHQYQKNPFFYSVMGVFVVSIVHWSPSYSEQAMQPLMDAAHLSGAQLHGRPSTAAEQINMTPCNRHQGRHVCMGPQPSSEACRPELLSRTDASESVLNTVCLWQFTVQCS